jgi:hypothetical protein
MNGPPLDDTVRVRMQEIRCEIDQDLEDVSASAHRMIDWKHYMRMYPRACLGTAAMLGYLIVPKRSKAMHADLATPNDRAKTAPSVVSSVSAARGVVDGLVGAVVGIAVREAIAYLGQNAGRLLGVSTDPGESQQ